ncbi:hypothetical protein J4E90_007408 [Alternaria incomplexa]|uniref:uncharacterized protein n=1 Tax=Alternaria incomplexa TaxID=1187928 RepID=UPI00221F2461|nr:uncharacterized protein J4E90_007408 [Alternaria incomplexa]KAI4911150.1 hypothetical protein J4E90_007408 [Alternaria incomplexa]
MSYEYDSRYHHRPRHDSHYTSRETDPYGYARSDKTLAEAREQLADMRQSNPYTSSYSSSYNTYTYEPRTSPPLPPRRPAPHSYRSHRQEQTWPPSPSVEDEREALAKEAPSSVGSPGQAEGEPPSNTRGTVDQDSLLDEIEQPSVAQHDRRYVLVSESSTDDDGSTLRDRRRRSFADRGGMSHINTDVPDPPVFTERVRAPYGYSKPQKESTAPSPTADYMRSPDPITPSHSSHPRSDASRPSRPMPTESRHNSYTSPASKKEYVFDSDSDSEAHSTTHLRTERKPARYSFVKSDLQREDLRTNLRDTQDRPEPRRHDSGQRPLPTIRKDNKNFNICPSCYDGVFAGTPFDVDFRQIWLNDYSMERSCDFSSPWARLAWLLTLQRGRKSLDLIYAIAGVMDTVAKPCPGDREAGAEDRISWYGITNPRDGTRVANFAICSSDRRMLEALLPSLRGCFAKMPKDDRHVCSLRTSSTRFPKYLDLLVELDAEAELSGQLPDLSRFVLLLRENSYKGECQRYKILFRKPWHFIPSLPEFTVCEQCYDELIWPATQSRSTSSSIPHMFNKSIQLVPGEDPDVGSSCCLWSPRMRDVWKEAVRYDDFSYLKSQAKERKRAESKYMRNRKHIMTWMGDAEKGTRKWKEAEDAMRELKKTPKDLTAPAERGADAPQSILTRDQKRNERKERIRSVVRENAQLKRDVKERDNMISRLQEFHQALEKDLADEKRQLKASRENVWSERREVRLLRTELTSVQWQLESLRALLPDSDLEWRYGGNNWHDVYGDKRYDDEEDEEEDEEAHEEEEDDNSIKREVQATARRYRDMLRDR